MLTGQRAFPGDDVSDTLAAVLKSEPDWTALRPTRRAIRRLLRRCLDKDRKRRLVDIADARLESRTRSVAQRPTDNSRSACRNGRNQNERQ